MTAIDRAESKVHAVAKIMYNVPYRKHICLCTHQRTTYVLCIRARSEAIKNEAAHIHTQLTCLACTESPALPELAEVPRYCLHYGI